MAPRVAGAASVLTAVSSAPAPPTPSVVKVPRLYLNHIADLDWLIALEFGRVDDAQPPDNWRGVCDSFGFLHTVAVGKLRQQAFKPRRNGI